MLLNAFLIALREIRRNLTRAFLTVLGIIIGVCAVITMVTLGQGATQTVNNQIASLGSNLYMISPGSGFGPGTSRVGIPGFSEKDITAIVEQVPDVVAAAPMSRTSLSAIHVQQSRMSSITGTTPDYFSIGGWKLADGRFFNEADLRAGRAVCVIGNTVQRELFEGVNPVGARLRLGKTSCEVIGVLASKGQSGMGDQDDTILVPLSTLQRRLTGRTSSHEIGQIQLSGREGADSANLIRQVTTLLRQRRHLQANEEDNFSMIDTRQIADMLSSSTRIMTALLAAVSAVSLVVGGIGIMNIMLVSVTERTREIGIRLAIGARAREVLLQFLVEAVTLSSIGGVIGVLLALVLCIGLSVLIQVPFLFDVRINVISFLFSTAVGVIFGYTPAQRAARLDPIQALRNE